MSFFEKLHDLQNAPKPKRKLVLVIFVAFFMSIIIGLWILADKNKSQTAAPANSIKKPFALIWEKLKGNLRSKSNRPFYETK